MIFVLRKNLNTKGTKGFTKDTEKRRPLDMRKLIAAMNMTLDGFCDHTAMIADDIIGTEVKKCQ